VLVPASQKTINLSLEMSKFEGPTGFPLLRLAPDPLVNVRQFTLLEIGLEADTFRLGHLFGGLLG